MAVSDNIMNFNLKLQGLEPLGQEFIISKYQGNIVLELQKQSNSNQDEKLYPTQATQELIKSLRHYNQDCPILAKISQKDQFSIVRVVGGDSTKGSLCLEMESDILPETRLQFFTTANRNRMNDHAECAQRIKGEGDLPHLGFIGLDVTNGEYAPLTVESELGLIGAGKSIYSKFQILKTIGARLQS